MQGKTYQILFIYISSLYASEHCWFVGSQWTNQESGKTIELAKKYLHGNNTEIDRGKMAVTAGIAASILGIGMRALPNDLSSREINSPDKLDISNLLETANDAAVFGMHRGSMQPNKSNIRNSCHLKQINEAREPLDSASHRSSTDDADGDYSYLLQTVNNTGTAGQPPVISGETTALMIEPSYNDQDNPQDNEIHTQEQKGAAHIGLANKQGRTKIYAGIGCCFLVFCVVTTALILKYTIMNKEKPIGKLYGHNDSITIPATKTIDQTTEITTEPWPITQQDGINSTSSAGEATTVQNARVDNISSLADICEPYRDIKAVCSELGGTAVDSCMITMMKCMNKNRQPDGDITVPTACEHTVDKTNIREFFYDNFTKKLNGAIQKVQNISRLNCDATFNGFNTTIQEMLNRYNCGLNDVFENAVEQRSLELCNAFKEGKASISEMCLAQKHIMEQCQRLNDWPTDLIGSIGGDTQHRFVNCTRTYDRNYFTKHLSPEEHLGQDENSTSIGMESEEPVTIGFSMK